MAVKVYSCFLMGLNGRLVEVEADILQGLSAFTIVGLGDTAVQESKERIRSAIKNTQATYPQQKKVINLAPASIKKHGPLFDLPIAISLLAASKQIPEKVLEKALFAGELALDGTLRPISSAISLALFAKENQWPYLFLPESNAREASLIKGITIIPVRNLRELITQLKSTDPFKGFSFSKSNENEMRMVNAHVQASLEEVDLSFIQGQEQAKRALEISAAGKHHLLLYGVPGVGKTLLAKALNSLLPDLSEEEMFETMQIYSSAGLIDHEKPLIRKRPFRQIHHTASLISMVGGGHVIRPGEISLAHNGVLFLDEIAEFPRSHLEALRQPLEEKKIFLARYSGNIIFPAHFTLVAAMNPCPCGYYGDAVKNCTCPPQMVRHYHKKISGPLLDRLDLTVALSRPKMDFHSAKASPSSDLKNLKDKVAMALEIQLKRYKGFPLRTNGELTSQNIRKFIEMKNDAEAYLQAISEKLELSARSYLHLIKTARTIADLEGGSPLQKVHLAEAFQYKQMTWT